MISAIRLDLLVFCVTDLYAVLFLDRVITKEVGGLLVHDVQDLQCYPLHLSIGAGRAAELDEV